MRRYLDDWLVQSSSRESLLQVVLDLCQELGIVINPEKSNLVPSQVVQYLRVIINTQSFVASLSPGFCPPPRLPPVFGSLYWGCFPPWLASSQVGDCA